VAAPQAQRKKGTRRPSSLLHRLENALFFRQPSGVELRPIFDKKQIAIGKWQLAFLGFGVSLRDVPQRLKPQDFIEPCRRSKDVKFHDI